MKKNKFTITMIVLLLAIALFFIMLIVFGNSPIYNQRIFLLKHSTYFILITLVTVTLLYLFYHLIKHNYLARGYNILYLNSFTLAVFTVTLLITSSLRIDYIETYETPIVTYFVLYDDYHNRIYDSTLKRSDVDIEVIEKSDTKLTLEIIEQSSGLTYKYVEGEATYEIPLNYESRSLIDIQYDVYNRITDYMIKQEFIEERNDLGDKSYSQSSRVFIMENTYSRYAFTSNRKSSSVINNHLTDGYYDFEDISLNEIIMTAAYDDDYDDVFVNFYDQFTIPLEMDSLNNEISFTYPPTNTSGLIDDFGFIDFNNHTVTTLINSPQNKRGELIEYLSKKELFLANTIQGAYDHASNIEYNYQEDVNDTYLFGTMVQQGDVLEYIQIDTTTFGYKTTFFRYQDKETSSFELKWLYEQAPTFAGEAGVTIYFDYYDVLYNYYSQKNRYYILFEENPIYDFLE